MAVRVRDWFRQRSAQCLLQIVGQNLGAADSHIVFLLGDFLCAGNDARLGARRPVVEPDTARGRLVSFELVCRVRATLARPLLSRLYRSTQPCRLPSSLA